MGADFGEPVFGVEGIGFGAMEDSVPVAAFFGKEVPGNFVGGFPVAVAEMIVYRMHPPNNISDMPQKTALVLSAGGMFGAYQAGAYSVIREEMEIDAVAGASVGALNGWPIASGCTPEHLCERWMDPNSGKVLSLFPNAGVWNGWFDPTPLQEIAEELFANYKPRIPFGLVVTEVPTFRTRVVREAEMVASHLRATCSIPYFLPAVKIAGRRYLDGGLFDKLPVRAALEMGATRLIAIDSLPDVMPAWIRAGFNFGHMFRTKQRMPAGVTMTTIAPSENLGTANDAVFWTEANVRRWIALGKKDAAAALKAV